MLKFILALFCFLTVAPAWAKKGPGKAAVVTQKSLNPYLVSQFKKNLSKKEIVTLQKATLKQAGKAIPTLIEVMKSAKYPDKSRWIATFLVGRIMGEKSSPFISKFLKHPHWVMRMASLKTLLALKQKRYADQYALALGDKSLIVRKQALDNIRKLSLFQKAPNVWAMLYDKQNYYVNKKGKRRTNLVREAIRTVGELRFEKAKKPLLAMVQKKKYEDVFSDIDYSLSLITGKKSPQGKISAKRRYWRKITLMNTTI